MPKDRLDVIVDIFDYYSLLLISFMSEKKILGHLDLISLCMTNYAQQLGDTSMGKC